ncbi:MAG: ABC transporter permease subunit, partial [Candidatus Thorarchaeota archaeon]
MMSLQFDLQSLVGRFRVWMLTFRGGLTLFCLMGLLLVPVTGNEYLTTIVITAMILSIFAASWDLLAGFAGQVSFGHSAFFGIAGYITAAFVRFFGFHWAIALIAGAAMAVVVSLLI